MTIEPSTIIKRFEPIYFLNLVRNPVSISRLWFVLNAAILNNKLLNMTSSTIYGRPLFIDSKYLRLSTRKKLLLILLGVLGVILIPSNRIEALDHILGIGSSLVHLAICGRGYSLELLGNIKEVRGKNMSSFNVILRHLDVEILCLLQSRLILKLLINEILLRILNEDISLFVDHILLFLRSNIILFICRLSCKSIIDTPVLKILDTVLVKDF